MLGVGTEGHWHPDRGEEALEVVEDHGGEDLDVQDLGEVDHGDDPVVVVAHILPG